MFRQFFYSIISILFKCLKKKATGREEVFYLTGCSVVRLTEADSPAVQQLLEKCDDFHILVTGLPAGKNESVDLFNDLPHGRSLPDKTVLGVIKDEQLIGVLDSIDGYPEPGTWFIGLFLLDPAHRGSGLGDKLITAYECWATQNGATTVMLGVVEENRRGYNFWQKCGYLMVEEKPARAFGNKNQKVYMFRKSFISTLLPK